MANVNWVVVSAVVLSGSAWAQPGGGVPAAPKAKAAVAAGVVRVPVPMKGLGSAKEEDEPVPTVSKSEADTALLRALLFAFEPAPTEIRVIAIEDLGLLGDARALNPLAQLVMDPNVNVQMAALRSIGSMQHSRAEAILANIIRHPSITERVKLAAIDEIIFQNTPSSIAFLQQLGRGGSFHPALQQQARRVLLYVPPPPTPPSGNSL